MRRLCTIEEFAQLPEQQRDGQALSITTTALGMPELGASGRTVGYVFSTTQVGRDLHTVAADAWQMENFNRNPVFLWFHDDSQPPIGRVIEIANVEGQLRGTVEYAEADLSPFADMIYRMVKARYINAVSTSWAPLAWSFSHDKARPGGIDFKKVDLLEISQVPIPALPAALATARAAGIDTTPMVAWAERLLDGEGRTLVARDELESLRQLARSVPRRPARPDGKDGNDSKERTAVKTNRARALARSPKTPTFKRGLYDVAQMAYLLANLGYLHTNAIEEADFEGDDSPVPGLLAEALATFAEAFKTAATEEANELLEAHEDGDGEEEGGEPETRGLAAEERAYIAAGATPRARAWRAGLAVARAGKALSKSNEEKLEEAQDHHERALKHHRSLGEHQEAVGEHIEAAEEHHERATNSLAQLGEHLRAIQDPESPELGTEALDEAVKYHRAATGHLEKLGDEHTNMADRNEDVGDSHRALGRCVKSAQRCVRSVVDGAETSEPESKGADELKEDQKPEAEKARRLRLAKAHQLRARGEAA